MQLTAHNLVSKTGNDRISFVVWSRQGDGMVNIFGNGSSGEMRTIQDARKYWNDMVTKFGYKKAPETTIEPN